MARYFFSLIGKVQVDDNEGEEFSSLKAATDAAREGAHDLAHNRASGDARWRTLRVTDENGVEVAAFAIFHE